MNRLSKLWAILILSNNFLVAESNSSSLDSKLGVWSYAFCVETVSFDKNGEGYVKVNKDDLSEEFQAPHFVQTHIGGCQRVAIGEPRSVNIQTQNPVCYVSGSKASISATFSTTCPKPFYIRGLATTSGGDSYNFPSRLVQALPGGSVSYPLSESATSFPNGKVKFYEQFAITWQVSEDESKWNSVDVSNNPVYVIKEFEEELPNYDSPWQWSAIHLSCMAAHNLTGDNDIVISHGDLLNQGNVERVDGHVLSYWLTDNFCSGGKYLISGGNGQCLAWADLMALLGAVQGIYDFELYEVFPHGSGSSPNNAAIISYLHSQGYGFSESDLSTVFTRTIVVHEWGDDEVVYLGRSQSSPVDVRRLLFDDPGGQSGIGGQGNPNPRSVFESHALFKSILTNKYYDSSYPGNPPNGSNIFASQVNWEDASLHATRGFIFSEYRDINGNINNPPKIYIYMKRLNTTGLECVYEKIR